MKPSIPKGTRDFTPEDMLKRNFLFDTIKSSFQRFGYLPLETPSMENLSTLMGKYGEEGDKLIFKILNSGDWTDNLQVSQETFKGLFDEGFHENNLNENKFVPLNRIVGPTASNTRKISEKALRYDLTVPFARYVVMHQHEIAFPFKRYQIQPVWRADRPQKGRYREFFQCDADVIGTNSLLCELELLQLIDDVFAKLGLNVVVLINNRKILSGIAEVFNESNRIIDITVAIDKLDKVGPEKVAEEMRSKGVSEKAIDGLKPLLVFEGSDQDKIDLLKKLLNSSEIGMQGIAELETLLEYASPFTFKNIEYKIDITLARGLNYYTGAIFEVKTNEPKATFNSSICGGGRYDDLTGIFGLPGMSGVGISFGADRICDVMDELNLFPTNVESSLDLLFINFGEDDIPYSLQLLNKVRSAGINAEMYPDAAKMKKQFSYADARKIPFVVMAGSEERAASTLMLKNMKSGDQQKMDLNSLIEFIRNRN